MTVIEILIPAYVNGQPITLVAEYDSLMALTRAGALHIKEIREGTATTATVEGQEQP